MYGAWQMTPIIGCIMQCIVGELDSSPVELFVTLLNRTSQPQ
jgi:hypothetical protein